MGDPFRGRVQGRGSDVSPALDVARDRLAALVDDPRSVQDTSTIALAALALGPEETNWR